MSEMLGNHYFLSRNFYLAKDSYERALAKDERNSVIKKKLVICYIKTGEINRALENFLNIVESKIDVILSTRYTDEDCPCPEIIAEIEAPGTFYFTEYEKRIALGMLWLYCDYSKSLIHFKIAFELKPADESIQRILKVLMEKDTDLNNSPKNN